MASAEAVALEVSSRSTWSLGGVVSMGSAEAAAAAVGGAAGEAG